MQRKTHWLDSIGQKLWNQVHEGADQSRTALKGSVPVGMVSLSPDEQLSKFLNMQPEQLDQIRQQVGDDQYNQYVGAMQKLTQQKLGPMASLFSELGVL